MRGALFHDEVLAEWIWDFQRSAYPASTDEAESDGIGPLCIGWPRNRSHSSGESCRRETGRQLFREVAPFKSAADVHVATIEETSRFSAHLPARVLQLA